MVVEYAAAVTGVSSLCTPPRPFLPEFDHGLVALQVSATIEVSVPEGRIE
jgi:hypothetical protein